jgi:hypothetical protein
MCREEIIGDIIAALQANRNPLKEFSRWGEWERDVLCRLPNPDELQALILERQGLVDTESECASLLEEYLAKRLATLPYPYDPLKAQVRIPNEIAVNWYNDAMGTRDKTAAVARAIRQLIDEGDSIRLSVDKTRKYGRCFVWTGENADIRKPISNDLQDRINGMSEVTDSQ